MCDCASGSAGPDAGNPVMVCGTPEGGLWIILPPALAAKICVTPAPEGYDLKVGEGGTVKFPPDTRGKIDSPGAAPVRLDGTDPAPKVLHFPCGGSVRIAVRSGLEVKGAGGVPRPLPAWRE